MDSAKCYEILGVGKNAPIKEIKRAFRKLSLKYHPDRNRSEQDGIKFKEITEAYQILKHKQKKDYSSKKDVESAQTYFWKYYDKKMNEGSQFYNRTDSHNFRGSFAGKPTEKSHDKEKQFSHKITHLVLYAGLSLMAIWIILSELLR